MLSNKLSVAAYYRTEIRGEVEYFLVQIQNQRLRRRNVWRVPRRASVCSISLTSKLYPTLAEKLARSRKAAARHFVSATRSTFRPLSLLHDRQRAGPTLRVSSSSRPFCQQNGCTAHWNATGLRLSSGSLHGTRLEFGNFSKRINSR